jgi:hypothetical protein
MTLRENFDKLSNEELLNKIATQALTSEAEVIAREVLMTRGVVAPEESQSITDEPQPSILARLQRLVRTCITGEASLGSAYWSLGLLLFSVAVVALLGYEFTRLTLAGDVFSYLLTAVIILGNPFHAYCVWKCSKNTNNALFGHIAKMYAGLQLLVWCGLIPFAMIASMFQ